MNIISPLIVTNTDRVIVLWLVECCFTSTETVGLLGTGAQDGHLDFYTAPELCRFVAKPEGYIPIEQHVVQISSRWYSSARESQYTLNLVSQKFPQRCL